LEPFESDIPELEKKANNIRKGIIRQVAAAGSGHPGGSLSSVEVLTALYFGVMRHDPQKPDWPDRDRLYVSKGHITPGYYAALAEANYFPKDELDNFRKFGSRLQGHPCLSKGLPGVEVSAGSLGQGLSIACGVALAHKLDGIGNRVYCLTGDGEWQEGSMWEAAMMASHYALDNLTAIIDFNLLQIDGRVREVMNIEPFAEKMAAFGWRVIDCDGHDIEALLAAFAGAKSTEGTPQMIIARTIKGKGVSFMEDVVDWHSKAPTEEEYTQAMAELEKKERGLS
jgi:transketolase